MRIKKERKQKTEILYSTKRRKKEQSITKQVVNKEDKEEIPQGKRMKQNR